MAYTKTEWANGATALSAENMNHIETGIKDAHDTLANVYSKSEVYRKDEVYGKSEIVISTEEAPETGTPNTFYIQIV